MKTIRILSAVRGRIDRTILKLKLWRTGGDAATVYEMPCPLLSAKVKTLSYMKWAFNHMSNNEYLFDAFFKLIVMPFTVDS